MIQIDACSFSWKNIFHKKILFFNALSFWIFFFSSLTFFVQLFLWNLVFQNTTSCFMKKFVKYKFVFRHTLCISLYFKIRTWCWIRVRKYRHLLLNKKQPPQRSGQNNLKIHAHISEIFKGDVYFFENCIFLIFVFWKMSWFFWVLVFWKRIGFLGFQQKFENLGVSKRVNGWINGNTQPKWSISQAEFENSTVWNSFFDQFSDFGRQVHGWQRLKLVWPSCYAHTNVLGKVFKFVV